MKDTRYTAEKIKALLVGGAVFVVGGRRYHAVERATPENTNGKAFVSEYVTVFEFSGGDSTEIVKKERHTLAHTSELLSEMEWRVDMANSEPGTWVLDDAPGEVGGDGRP